MVQNWTVGILDGDPVPGLNAIAAAAKISNHRLAYAPGAR
jgi:hypothetical protein